MSTGLECEFIETNGDWFYFLQDGDCPVGAWDWRDYSTPYGPFGSYDIAVDHLHDNHANPGGFSVIEYGDAPVTGVVAKLIEKARS